MEYGKESAFMKISIITVCLNSAQTIEQTIQSVIGQKYDNYEYIIIDGCSTDKTLEILNKYKEYITTIVSEPDNGIYDAMNKGIALAAGDIIGILNSDDWYEPGILETVEKCFQDSDTDIIYGRLNVFKENGERETAKESHIEKIRYEMAIPHPTVFVKKDIYVKYGTFKLEYRISADYELMLRFYTKEARFLCVNKVITNFRRGGISARQGRLAEEETLRIARKYLAYAPPGERNRLKDILNHRSRALYFERLIGDFPSMVPDTLNTELGAGIKEDIVIFGSGKWGTKVYDVLLQKGIRPLFFIDNNRKKQRQGNHGRTVMPPESLRTYKGIVLILVREFADEILIQVKGFQNPDIYCITWNDIIDSHMLSMSKGMDTIEARQE